MASMRFAVRYGLAAAFLAALDDFAAKRAQHVVDAFAGDAGNQHGHSWPQAFSSAARFLASAALAIASILLSATISGLSSSPWP